MFKSLQYIKTITSKVDTNDLCRYLTSGEDDLSLQQHAFALAIMAKELFPDHKMVQIYNRPNIDNPANECYVNSYYEWQETGNKPLMVYEAFITGGVVSITPHACNITSAGKVYDTDFFPPGKRGSTRWGFILKDTEEMMEWLTHYEKHRELIDVPTLTYGDWMIIIRDDKAWATHCTKTHPGKPDNITRFDTYKYNTMEMIAEILRLEAE